MSHRPIVLAFMKYPEPGKVKTRLASQIGDRVAADLYRQWIGILLENMQAARSHARLVAYFDGAAVEQFSPWGALVDEWLLQPAGQLGERLAAGFDWGHSKGHPVLAIGTDCLDLQATHVYRAIEALHEADAVFGPATDGGYYLVGTRRNVSGLFNGVRWSSPHTLEDQLARCRQMGLDVALLEELADIDTLEDWQAYERRGPQP